MKIQNPHDKFFKETFGNVVVANDFLNNYLPENIMEIVDMNTLEPQKDSFINAELKEAFSDLLFSVNINNEKGYLYFLFEHKSYTSKDIAFQLLKYMTDIWEAKIKKEGLNELPIIIPLVIYHGKDEWNIKISLGEMINGYDELSDNIRKYIPNFEYLLYDISRYSDEEIKGQAQLRIVLTMHRDIMTKSGKDLQQSLFRAVEYLTELEDKQTGIEYFKTVMRYIFSTRTELTEEDIQEMVGKIGNIYPEGSEVIMTLAERFIEKGKEEGIKKGKEEGIKEGIKEEGIKDSMQKVVKKSIVKGLTTEDIIEITGLTKEVIEEIRKKM